MMFLLELTCTNRRIFIFNDLHISKESRIFKPES